MYSCHAERGRRLSRPAYEEPDDAEQFVRRGARGCRIGPDMFRDLFIPAIERQIDSLDHAVYHVDGIGNFAHVEALCELENLQALQILPGAGKPSPLHYVDELKTVQQAGKNLHLSLPANEVRPALEMLRARGLFISTGCGSEAEARRLLEDAERWSVDRG